MRFRIARVSMLVVPPTGAPSRPGVKLIYDTAADRIGVQVTDPDSPIFGTCLFVSAADVEEVKTRGEERDKIEVGA